MAKKSEIDRLSALPDLILTCNIFSHLSLRDVVRTSILSTRWRSLWKQIPHLDFSKELFQSLKLPFRIGRRVPRNERIQNVEYINTIIDNILLLHSGHIERFCLHVTFSGHSWNTFSIESPLEKLRLHQWIHHAALKEVKYMSLENYSEIIDVPPSIFACHGLRDLELYRFRFTGIPTEFDGFRFLQSCSLTYLPDLTNDDLKQLIGLSPLLRKLVLIRCWKLINLKIQAPNLNSLHIEDCNNMVSLTADCPQLIELAIENCVNDLAIENCYSLIELKIDPCVFFDDLHTSYVRKLKEHPMLNSLRKLYLSVSRFSDVSGPTLLTILGYFHNLEEVHIQIFGYKFCYSKRITARGELVADSTFPSLKAVYLDISSAIKKDEAIMLAFLLKNAPSLNTIRVTLPHCPKNIHDMEFKNKVLDLQQIYEKVDIRVEIDKDRLDASCEKTYLRKHKYRVR